MSASFHKNRIVKSLDSNDVDYIVEKFLESGYYALYCNGMSLYRAVSLFIGNEDGLNSKINFKDYDMIYPSIKCKIDIFGDVK